MWLDAHAVLAEIMRDHPATTATTATKALAVSQESRLSQLPQPKTHMANVADVAASRLQRVEQNSSPEAFPHGTAFNRGDAPLTWTGRIVSLADWRSMTDWEKHGPNGRHWNGITKCSVPPD